MFVNSCLGLNPHKLPNRHNPANPAWGTTTHTASQSTSHNVSDSRPPTQSASRKTLGIIIHNANTQGHPQADNNDVTASHTQQTEHQHSTIIVIIILVLVSDRCADSFRRRQFPTRPLCRNLSDTSPARGVAACTIRIFSHHSVPLQIRRARCSTVMFAGAKLRSLFGVPCG